MKYGNGVIAAAAKRLGCHPDVIYNRLKRGLTLEQATNIPICRNTRRRITAELLEMYNVDLFNESCGGIKVFILNSPNPDKGEKIYNLFNTNGERLRTNDKDEFMNYLQEVA